MDNTAALRKGAADAKEIIAFHIYIILVSAAKKLLEDATNGRIFLGHNMTGNTVNSYAVGVYSKGELVFTMTSSQGISKPLQRKLGLGQKFHRGRQRWDGEIQKRTFKASVATNGSTEAERSIAFIQSYNAPKDGYALVVCNGVEYAEYQESVRNIDVLTSNFNRLTGILQSSLKPLPN